MILTEYGMNVKPLGTTQLYTYYILATNNINMADARTSYS